MIKIKITSCVKDVSEKSKLPSIVIASVGVMALVFLIKLGDWHFIISLLVATILYSSSQVYKKYNYTFMSLALLVFFITLYSKSISVNTAKFALVCSVIYLLMELLATLYQRHQSKSS